MNLSHFLLLIVVDCTLCGDVTVSGNEGAEVLIQCLFSKGYGNYDKYFYKGIYRDRVIVLSSTEMTINGRFSMRDEKKTRTLTVTIRNLTMDDCGLYGCQAWSLFWQEYKHIHLHVNRAPKTSKPAHGFTSTSNQTPPHPPSRDAITDRTTTGSSAVVVGLVVVLLVLILCSGSFLLLKLRNRKCTPEETN